MEIQKTNVAPKNLKVSQSQNQQVVKLRKLFQGIATTLKTHIKLNSSEIQGLKEFGIEEVLGDFH